MKATDLMIGDWVLISVWGCKPFPSKVTSINYNSYQGKDFVDWIDTEDEEEIGMYNVQPISLTPEILEKNGFRYSDLPFENFYEGYGLQIHGGNYADGHSNWYIICGINVAMNVTYVHELQHALKLCGIDKNIVL